MTIPGGRTARIQHISTHILTKRMTNSKKEVQSVVHISTHILTKRMTMTGKSRHKERNISTHILTKRMTTASFPASPPPIFQLTSSQRGWRRIRRNFKRVSHFNSHPHKEDDASSAAMNRAAFIFQLTSSQRGWQRDLLPSPISISFQLTSSQRGWLDRYPSQFSSHHISTHILTKRMTWLDIPVIVRMSYFNSHPHKEDDVSTRWTRAAKSKFQLTSSQRGWPYTQWILPDYGHFNSHPHKEDDDKLRYDFVLFKSISTHILTKRMTRWEHEQQSGHHHFNSHPHKEDDDFSSIP